MWRAIPGSKFALAAWNRGDAKDHREGVSELHGKPTTRKAPFSKAHFPFNQGWFSAALADGLLSWPRSHANELKLSRKDMSLFRNCTFSLRAIRRKEDSCAHASRSFHTFFVRKLSEHYTCNTFPKSMVKRNVELRGICFANYQKVCFEGFGTAAVNPSVRHGDGRALLIGADKSPTNLGFGLVMAPS